MPLFHSNFHIRDSTTGEISGTPIDDWTSIINFLNPKNDHYISAFRALKNPDIHSAVMQLSGDLATATLTANGPRAQAFWIILLQLQTLERFGLQCLLK
nr:hypothetical protein [Oenococcus oeni]